jgi:hypothetical protein
VLKGEQRSTVRIGLPSLSPTISNIMGARKPDLLALFLVYTARARGASPIFLWLSRTNSWQNARPSDWRLSANLPGSKWKNQTCLWLSVEVNIQTFWQPEESTQAHAQKLILFTGPQLPSLSRLYNPAPPPSVPFLLHLRSSSLQTTSAITSIQIQRLQPGFSLRAVRTTQLPACIRCSHRAFFFLQ